MKRRIIGVLLCVSMLAGMTALPASAEARNNQDVYPVVLVRGVDFFGLYLDYATDSERPCVGEISAAGIVKTLFKAIGTGLFSWSMDRAVDVIIDYAADILGGLTCDETGASLQNVGCPKYPAAVGTYADFPFSDGNEMGILKSTAEHYGGENVYYVNYDWRMDPRDVADEIAATVDRAVTETDAPKVNLVSASMGGVMTVAYMSEYGYSKLNKCVFLSSTFCGVKAVSDLFQGRVEASPEALYNFLDDNLGGSKGADFLIKTAKSYGLFNGVSSVANKFLDTYKPVIYNELLNDCFCHTLSFWTLVLPEDYDACVDYIFGGEEAENAVFIAKIDALQAMMRGRDDLLRQAAADGVQFSVVASYNSAHVPLYPSAVLNGDNGLETVYMSGGARVANYGETLPTDILAANSVYLSKDGVVDASTCLFRDATWFLKDAPHVGFNYGTDCADFLIWMLDYDGQATVFSNPAYPQFMHADKSLSLSANLS